MSLPWLKPPANDLDGGFKAAGLNLSSIPEFLLERIAAISANSAPQETSQKMPFNIESVEKDSDEPQSNPKSNVSSSPSPHLSSPQPISSSNDFTEIEKSILEMLFGNDLNPSAELIEATARETGIESQKIKKWIEMNKSRPEEKAGVTSSEHSDSISMTKENEFEFSDEESSERLKIVENDSNEAGANITPADKKSLANTIHDNSCTNSDTDNSNRRMRTLISPDQAEVLYREYLEVII